MLSVDSKNGVPTRDVSMGQLAHPAEDPDHLDDVVAIGGLGLLLEVLAEVRQRGRPLAGAPEQEPAIAAVIG